MIIEVVGKEIEKIKGDFESYLNGLNMVGDISYSQYSELYDEGTKQIQKAYELGKAELEKACEETQELLDKQIEATYKLDKENAELKKDKKELCHSISEGGKACVYLNEQLTNAKELLAKWVKLCKPKLEGYPIPPIQEQTEQFLKECK